MSWNWQHATYPNFTYEVENLADYEKDFLHKAGIIHGSLKHISTEDQDILKVDLISDEAYKTSEIEGEILRVFTLLKMAMAVLGVPYWKRLCLKV